MATIDMVRVNSRISRAKSRKLENKALSLAGARLREAKRDAIEYIENHPVTRSLSNKTGGDGGGLIPKGSLYGFLGFNEGSDPARELLDIMNDKISLGNIKRKTKRGGLFDIEVNFPSLEEVAQEVEDLEWTADSWIDLIENGISGYRNFYRGKAKNSRSGGGIQVKKDLRTWDGETLPTIYYSGAESRFLRKIKTTFGLRRGSDFL